MFGVVVRWEACGQRVPGFYSRWQHLYCMFSFWMRGGDRLAGRYKRRKPDQAGRYKIFLMWGVGGGLCPALSASSVTDTLGWYNIITHKRLSHRQQFSASQDADSISLALNNSCPRSHFHTGNNDTIIPLSGITVYIGICTIQDVHTNPRDIGRSPLYLKWSQGCWGNHVGNFYAFIGMKPVSPCI